MLYFNFFIVKNLFNQVDSIKVNSLFFKVDLVKMAD